uniref:Pco070235b n=1 Tax=Arundo donax TaxID=35708 RepID=A0A0A8XZC4_ARUDO
MYLASMKGSLTATTSISSRLVAIRRTSLPIRPNPLMPTLVFSPLEDWGVAEGTCVAVALNGSTLLAYEGEAPIEGKLQMILVLTHDTLPGSAARDPATAAGEAEARRETERDAMRFGGA